MVETTASEAPAPRDGEPSPGHFVVPVGLYVAVYFALLVLTVVTAAVAFLDLGPMNNVMALGIAILKGSLVVLFFMHVRWSSRLIGLAWLAGLLLLVTLISGTLADYTTRSLLGVPGK